MSSMRLRCSVVAVGLAAAGVAAGPGARAAAILVPTLTVNFNQDGSISVALQDGTPVGTPNPPGTLIPAGTYQVVINNAYRDDTNIVHRFDLRGPGVELVTDMNEGEELQDSWTETFQPGSTYTYQDDNQPGIHGVFQTSAAAAAAAGGSSSGPGAGGSSAAGTVANVPGTQPAKLSAAGTAISSAPFRGTLRGSVSPAGALTLTDGGKAVTSLRAGRYRLAVTDRSATSGFTIQEAGNGAVTVTTVPFVGVRTLTVDLRPGQWFYYPSFLGRKTYFIVVA